MSFCCVQAYVNFSAAPTTVKKTDRPMSSPTRSLPAFIHGETVLSSSKEIATHLRLAVRFRLNLAVL